jgi:elongation factor P--beta-lysine ligase
MPKAFELKNDPSKWQGIFIKELILKSIRNFFNKRGYHELESPILAPTLPQERYLNVLSTKIADQEVYLIPSTERYNKLALCAGIGNHFVISKVFRGQEEISRNHAPEFSMLEWYELEHDYFHLMQTTQELLIQIKKYLDRKLRRAVNLQLKYQGQSIDLRAPFPRISVRDCLKRYAGIELADIQNLKDFQTLAAKKHYQNAQEYDWQTLFELIFANEIEPQMPINRPCFVYDYPVQLCPLTKVNPNDPLVAMKVELYLAGKEIANGYTEQTDWQEQEQRFIEEAAARKELGLKAISMEQEMIELMKLGMPDVAGIGMGIDRLAMIYADAANLSDVNLTSF